MNLYPLLIGPLHHADVYSQCRGFWSPSTCFHLSGSIRSKMAEILLHTYVLKCQFSTMCSTTSNEYSSLHITVDSAFEIHSSLGIERRLHDWCLGKDIWWHLTRWGEGTCIVTLRDHGDTICMCQVATRGLSLWDSLGNSVRHFDQICIGTGSSQSIFTFCRQNLPLWWQVRTTQACWMS